MIWRCPFCSSTAYRRELIRYVHESLSHNITIVEDITEHCMGHWRPYTEQEEKDLYFGFAHDVEDTSCPCVAHRRVYTGECLEGIPVTVRRP